MSDIKLVVQSDDFGMCHAGNVGVVEAFTIHMLSGRPSEEKVPYLLDRIAKLEAGKHLIVSHCAVESDELRSMTSDDADNSEWALQYRVSDLAALTSPEVRRAVEQHGIELVSVRDLRWERRLWPPLPSLRRAHGRG